MKNEDEVKRESDDAAANAEPSRSTRRQFLKGLTTGTVAIGALTQSGCAPAIPPLKTRGATATTTICPFCGVGCGQVVSTRNGNVINIEGDPGHPISEGTLCSKGAAGEILVNGTYVSGAEPAWIERVVLEELDATGNTIGSSMFVCEYLQRTTN